MRAFSTKTADASFEAHVMWGSTMRIRAGLRVGPPEAVRSRGGLLARLPTVVVPAVEVADVAFHGPVHLTLDRLAPNMSLFGSLRASFPDPPSVRLSLGVLSPLDVAALPGVGSLVRWAVRTQVMAMAGFPRAIEVPMDDGPPGDPDGLLQIRRIRVRDLKNATPLSLDVPDAYVVVACTTRGAPPDGGRVLAKRRTSVAWNKRTHQARRRGRGGEEASPPIDVAPPGRPAARPPGRPAAHPATHPPARPPSPCRSGETSSSCWWDVGRRSSSP